MGLCSRASPGLPRRRRTGGDSLSHDADKELFLDALDVAIPERVEFVRRRAPDPAAAERVLRLLRANDAGPFALDAAPPRPLTDLVRSASPTKDEVVAGAMIGPFRVERRLGDGGFGTVYLASQELPVRRRVAVKVLKASVAGEATLARFAAEREVLALMDHEGIARILDAGQDEAGRSWVAMEFVDGPPIGAYCDARRLDLRARVELLVRVGLAIEHAHQKGVLHRDLKPSNVLVTEQDGAARTKVIDFGIAKVFGGVLALEGHETLGEAVLGTPLYMAPEQMVAGRDVDTRADVFGLGALLYELLAGTPLREPEAVRKALLAGGDVGAALPERPSVRVSGLGAKADRVAAARGVDAARLVRLLRDDLDWIVVRAVDPDRERRYPTVSALLADLRRYLAHEPVEAGPPTVGYRFRKFARRHRGALAAAALVVLALLLGTGIAIQGRLLAEEQRQEAVRNLGEAEAVTDLLSRALMSTSPRDLGRDATLPEIVERVDAEIPRRLAGQPRAEALVRETLGHAYLHLGKTAESRRNFERAAAVAEETLGPNDPLTVSALIGAARLKMEIGSMSEARAELVRIRTRAGPVLGDEHRLVLAADRFIAKAVEEEGDLVAAERLGRAVLLARERAYGPDDHDTVQSRIDLGLLLGKRGRFDEAEAELATALAVIERRDSADHADALVVRRGLADVAGRRQDFGIARERYAALLERCERVFGPDHPETIGARNGLAVCCASLGSPDEAATLWERNLEMQRRRLGPRSPEVLSTLHNLAVLEGLRGDHESERRLKREVYEAKLEVLSAEHPETALAAVTLARVELSLGNAEAALALLDAAREAYRKHLVAGDPRRIEAAALRAEAARRAGVADAELEEIVNERLDERQAAGQDDRASPVVLRAAGLDLAACEPKELRRPEIARGFLRRFAAGSPELDVEVCEALATLEAELGDQPRAVEVLERGLQDERLSAGDRERLRARLADLRAKTLPERRPGD